MSGLFSRLGRVNGSFAPAGNEPISMSLLEAVSEVTMVMHESVVELENADFTGQRSLIEAACEGMADADFMNLNESVLDTVKTKIKALFEKIKKVIKMVIEKITQTINSIRMSGSQLVSKYKEKVRGKNYKDFTFEGYKFVDNIGSKFVVAKVEIDKFLEGLGFKKTVEDIKGADHKETAEKINKLRDDLRDALTDSGAAKSKLFKQITSIDASSTDKFRSELFKAFRGDKDTKVEIGKNLNIDEIIKYLEKPDDLDKIRDQYTSLKTTVENIEKETNREIDGLKTVEGASNDESMALNAKATYMGDWVKALTDLLTVPSMINAAAVEAAKAKAEQCKSIFVKAMNYKDKKNENNSAEGEEFDEFDFNIE